MAARTSATLSGDEATKKVFLVQRRCVILALVGNTPISSNSLVQVLQNNFLKTTKSWLEEILNGSIGKFANSVSLLLLPPES